MKTRRKEHGASLVEHGVMVGLVAVVAIGAVSRLGLQVEESFSETTDALSVSLDHVLPDPERGPLAGQEQVCYEGTPGNDRISYDSEGTVYNCLHGYGGDDELIWLVSLPASFYPGLGNDYTRAGVGDQVHHYEGGHDTIENRSGDDTLILPRGTAFADATFSAPDLGSEFGARDLRIDLAQGSVTLLGQFDRDGASTFLFDDREVAREEISAIVLEPYPTEGADTLFATYGPDVISPLAGDDIVYAGYGDDRIIYSSGRDTYYPGHDNDTLVMPFNLSEIEVFIDGNQSDFYLTPQAGGRVAVPRQFSVAPGMNSNTRFTSFVFGDTTLTWDEMRLNALRQMEISSREAIFGTIVADEVWSSGGYMVVQPNQGDDIIHWQAGDMHLSGKGAGFDHLLLASVDRSTITASTMSEKDGIITLQDGTRIILEKILQTSEGDGQAPAERITFANGVVMEEREIRDLFGAP